MSRPTLTPEPQAEAQPIADTLMEAAREEISAIAELLASKPDHQLLGRTEFEVRDRVHKIGAKAIETALNGRKKGGIQGPVGSACWARSCAKTVPTIGARPVTRATSPGTQRWGSPPASRLRRLRN